MATIALATSYLVATACDLPGSGDPVIDSPTINTGEFAAASEQPCPEELPIGDDPAGHGFGVEQAADAVPSLLPPDRAWTCRYAPVEAGRTPNGGTYLEWVRAKEPTPVDPGRLASLQTALDNLLPPGQTFACTADLGPRWMGAYVHEGDVTGVVVDDYGWRDVRLTDDPLSTAPGARNQAGTVAGVLDGGQAILDALALGR